MTLFTIGFTKKSAAEFFGQIESAGVKRLIDVRLNNVSQLAGFTKRDDLAFFTQRIAAIPYVHLPVLAPTKPMLDAYKKKRISWEEYEHQFLSLMADRNIEDPSVLDLQDGDCLLCSEESPERCHRRLVLDYLRDHQVPWLVRDLR